MDTKLSLARIVELDKIWDTEVSKFLQMGVRYGNPPPLPLHEEYADQLPQMARKWRVDLGEFLAWVKLQHYISAAAQSDCENLPLPEDMASALGIPMQQFSGFQDYLHKQIRLTQEAFEEDEDDFTGQGPYAHAEDWDFEEDLLREAAMRGTCEG